VQTWNNQYLIFLSAELEKWIFKLTLKNIDFTVFYEPDLDNKPTALAVHGNDSLFRNLKLWGAL